MGSCLCDSCAALCCRYFALPIDNPTTRKDFDDIRWYLIHENVVVFIDKKQWHVGVLNRCKHLQADNRCGIYKTRPKICRSYSTDNCDWHGGEYDFVKLFVSAEQLMEYMPDYLAGLKKPARRKKRKSISKARAAALAGIAVKADAAGGNGKATVGLSVRGAKV